MAKKAEQEALRSVRVPRYRDDEGKVKHGGKREVVTELDAMTREQRDRLEERGYVAGATAPQTAGAEAEAEGNAGKKAAKKSSK